MTVPPRVTQIGKRKNGKPIVVCPKCGRKVCVSNHDQIETHYTGAVEKGWDTACQMSGKAVHFHTVSTNRPQTTIKVQDDKLAAAYFLASGSRETANDIAGVLSRSTPNMSEEFTHLAANFKRVCDLWVEAGFQP